MGMTSDNPDSLKKLSKALKQLDNMEIRAGWFDSAVYESGTPVAYVAAIQEFGSVAASIPARPFMRPTYTKKLTKWMQTFNMLAMRFLEGKMSLDDALNVTGEQIVGDIADKIESITAPPLSPITLGARKYRSEGKEVTGATIGEIAAKLKAGTLDISGVPNKPLDDTHHMLDTLTYVTGPAK